MRSVENTLCALSVALLAAGCASNPGADAPSRRLPPQPLPKPRAKPVAPPVDAAAQRGFDEARRALAAGQTAEAERRFLALTQSNPELGGPHASLGLIYQQAGKTGEAVLQFEAAVKASPQQPAYLNQLGVAYRQQGQFDKAREAYEKAIALAPDHATAMLNLGILNDLYLGDPSSCAGAVRTLSAADTGRRRDGQQMGRRPEEPQAADAGGEGQVMKSASTARDCTCLRQPWPAARPWRRTAPTSTAARSSATASCPRCCTSCRGRSRCPASCRAGRWSACSTKRWPRSTATCSAASCATTSSCSQPGAPLPCQPSETPRSPSPPLSSESPR